MSLAATLPFVAIACGGTGGHLFPGLAVGKALLQRGASVTLLISPKAIDQEAVRTAQGMEAITLPAVPFERPHVFRFLLGFGRAFRVARRLFRQRPPHAVLAMGGFLGAPPVLAAHLSGAATFLHESNAIPGRANRWLAPWVDGAFVGFPSAARRLWNRTVMVTGTPVRPGFRSRDAVACRRALGLDPAEPVLLVMGGSQGARAVNQLMLQALPLVAGRMPGLQFIHLTGPHDLEAVRSAYTGHRSRALVQPFVVDLEAVMGAASAAVSRAGASSLAEMAAVGLPAVLIPYPTAADNHQYVNALEFAQAGAARMLAQRGATAASLSGLIEELLRPGAARDEMRRALRQWDRPDAAEDVATRLLAAVQGRAARTAQAGRPFLPDGTPPGPTVAGRAPRETWAARLP